MASTTGFGGFKPYNGLSAANFNAQTNEYPIASGYGTSLFTGDPVTLDGSGTIVRAVVGDGNPILGIFQGVKYAWNQTTQSGNFIFSPQWTAGTVTQGAVNALALVVDDPNQELIAQVNADSFAQTALYQNYNFTFGAGGNAATGQSAALIDVSTGGTSATKQFKVIAFAPTVGNQINVTSGPATFVLCLINNHVYKGGTGTAGV